MSVRGDIVDKALARIPSGAAITITKSFKNPFREISEDELPCLKGALMRGRAREINNNIEYEHTDTLVIAYIDQGNDNELEDRLYAAGEAIINFMINDANNSGDENSLWQLVSNLEFESWDMDLKPGAAGTGAIVLNFNITYHTKHTLTFEDLEGVDVVIHPTHVPAENTDVIEETIDLPSE